MNEQVKQFLDPLNDAYLTLSVVVSSLVTVSSLSLLLKGKVLFVAILLSLVSGILLIYSLICKNKLRTLGKKEKAKKKKISQKIDSLKQYTILSGSLTILFWIAFAVYSVTIYNVNKEKRILSIKIENENHELQKIINQHRGRITPLTEWQEKADLGNTDAQAALGVLYQSGFGGQTTPDFHKAHYYLEAASTKNHAISCDQLGFMYYSGQGRDVDIEKVVSLLTKASNKGISKSQQFLGQLYFYGNEIPQDVVLAEKYLLMAAEQKNPMAAYQLHLLYAISNMEKKADIWLKKAAECGYEEAILILARKNIRDYKYKEGYSALKQLVKNNYIKAYEDLGICYRDGLGIMRDLPAAERCLLWGWSKNISEEGKTEYELGILYQMLGDSIKMHQWMDMAILNKNKEAERWKQTLVKK